MAEAATVLVPERLLVPRNEGIHAAAEFFDRAEIESEAWQLIQQRDRLPAVEVRHQEYKDNARTALMEALTASGHLSVVELQGTLEEINSQVLRRLLNGWDDSLPGHEQQRRFAELCNELFIQRTHRAIVEGFLPPDTEVAEISDYPEALRGTRLGYRDSNEKGMVRATGLRYNGGGQYTRRIEQVSRSNSTTGSTLGFLANCGVPLSTKPTDIAALEAPTLYSRSDYADGVISIMRTLDRYAGPGVLYGDTGERTLRHPVYAQLRHESQRREQEIICYVDDLAKLERQLDGLRVNGKVSAAECIDIFNHHVIRILDAICVRDPGYAEDTYGKQSVVIFEQAALLNAQGRSAEAAQLLIENNYLKETVTFCGMTITVDEAKAKGLEVDSLGKLVEKGKESWKWKQGVCVVKTCSTRPGRTEVGPCSVCRKCQDAFDNNNDPTKAVVRKKQLKNPATSKKLTLSRSAQI